MELQLVIAIISAFQAITVAVIGGLFAYSANKNKKIAEESRKEAEKIEARAAIRAKESFLSMKLMSACVKLTLLLAVEAEKSSMDSAVLAAKDAEESYQNFINKIGTDQLSKMDF